MLRIALCDDADTDRTALAGMLKRYMEGRGLSVSVYEFSSGEALLAQEDIFFFDMVFLDIYMRGMSGMDTARTLRVENKRLPLVFVTSSQDFALESYDVFAFGYLVKPVSEEKLASLLDRFLAERAAPPQPTFPILDTNGRCRMRVAYSKIEYVESENSKVVFHFTDGSTAVMYTSLSRIEAKLQDRRFLRCHQSFIVNMDHVRRATDCFEMASGSRALIRQRELRGIKERFLNYTFEQ